MSVVSQTDKPELFINAPALPEGWHYEIQSVSSYIFGYTNPLYQIIVIRDSDGVKYNGNAFYPGPWYTDYQNMLDSELQNAFNQFQNYYNVDVMVAAAQAAIGF